MHQWILPQTPICPLIWQGEVWSYWGISRPVPCECVSDAWRVLNHPSILYWPGLICIETICKTNSSSAPLWQVCGCVCVTEALLHLPQVFQALSHNSDIWILTFTKVLSLLTETNQFTPLIRSFWYWTNEPLSLMPNKIQNSTSRQMLFMLLQGTAWAGQLKGKPSKLAACRIK